MTVNEELLYIINKIEQQQREIIEQIEGLKLIITSTDLNNKLNKYDQNNNRVRIETSINDSEMLKNSAYDNLSNLYKQGYHVCNDLFGNLREGECLFCTPFLRKNSDR